MIKQEISRGYSYLKKKGIKSTIIKAKRHIKEQAAYKMWPVCNEEKLVKQKERVFPYMPLISIIVPLYNTPLEFLNELIDSVCAQTYGNWELCLADGTAKRSYITDRVEEYMSEDSRIKYKILDKNEGISGNTNQAMMMAEGEYIALADHDDILSPSALYEVVRAVNKNKFIDSVYTDEDKADTDGKGYYMPHFKPDYNQDYFQANNYICHFFVTKRSIALETGGFDSNFDGAQDYDFIWKCVEKSRVIHHIPKVLYHWRCHNDSTAGRPESKMYAYENGVKALKAHYERCGINADVSMYPDAFGYYKTEYIQDKTENITVIYIGKKDYSGSKNKHYGEEIYIGEYDVAKINEAVINQRNRYVLLLDINYEFTDENAVGTLLSYVKRDNTAVAGGRIYDRKGKLIFGGFILGAKGYFGYAFEGTDKRDRGYYLRICVPQETMAVCGNCMMIDTEYFLKTGGFDKDLSFNMSVADYCIKVRTATDKVAVYVPDAVCVSIMTMKENRYSANEINIFRKRWQNELKKGDPYYNRNLTLNRTDYSLRKRGHKY
ncbi:MAG: glycosyltransferase [Lachnospiraceae bacterium]|nr:glycosyltransferase [Lachnospiraceae bacterium]